MNLKFIVFFVFLTIAISLLDVEGKKANKKKKTGRTSGTDSKWSLSYSPAEIQKVIIKEDFCF